MRLLPALLLSLLLLPGTMRARGGEEVGPGSLLEFALEAEGRVALGVYMLGAKTGWMICEAHVGEEDGRKVLIDTTTTYLRVAFEDLEEVTAELERVVYSLEDDGPIIRVEMRTEESAGTRAVTAVQDGAEMIVTRVEDGETTARRVPMSRDTLGESWRLERWITAPRSPGDRFETVVSAWAEETIDEEMVLTYRESSTMLWAGAPTRVHRLGMTLGAMPLPGAVLTLENGEFVRFSMGRLGEARLEDERVARDLDLDVDMMAATAVPVDRDLGAPAAIEELTLLVTGAGDFTIPSSPRQRVARSDGRLTLTLTRGRNEGTASLAGAGLGSYLEATREIQSDAEEIRALATEITRDLGDPVERALALAAWVRENIEPRYAANSARAVAVLERRQGDCTELSLLFLALARAAGVPCRAAGGIVYAGLEEPCFAWHAWAEFHDGESWVSVDPTWGELPVDATHVKLSEGLDDYAWLRVLGQLELSVVAVRRSS